MFENTNEIDGKLDTVTDGLVAKIKNILLQNYEPVTTFSEGTILMSTLEIYTSLQTFYPSTYGIDDVASWLHEAGFHFIDSGNMRFEWMIKIN